MAIVVDRQKSSTPRCTERRAVTLDRSGTVDARDRSAPAEPPTSPPRGWGSRQERRDTLYALAFFAFLGSYAAAGVLIGTYVWD